VGGTVTMTPRGQDPVTSVITDIKANERYADQTEFGGVTLSFSHTLDRLPGGGTRVTHRLEITGDQAGEPGPRLGRRSPRTSPTRWPRCWLMPRRDQRPRRRRARPGRPPGHGPDYKPRGLIERETDPADTRAKRLRITEAGMALALAAIGQVERADAAFFGPLTGEGTTAAEITGLLRRLAE
jgi:hypothetical protein